MCCLIFSQGEAVVKHYHIKKNNEGKFYITEAYAFSSLAELVVFHKKDTHGKQPCKAVHDGYHELNLNK
jgi:hypothetical protein